MRLAGLRGLATIPPRVRTTDSRHDDPIAPNRLRRTFTTSAPNPRWLADLTYIRTGEGWLLLAEAEIHWRAFLESLVARGLRGVEIIVSDDHSGLRAVRRAVLIHRGRSACLVRSGRKLPDGPHGRGVRHLINFAPGADIRVRPRLARS